MNCIIIDDDKTSRVLIESYIKKTKTLELCGSFSSPIEALKSLRANQKIDLIFLDILMPQMNGLQVLDKINGEKQVIVVSGKKEFALETFNYQVTDYLLKPISYERFFNAAGKAYKKDRERNTNNNDFIIIKEKSFVKIDHSKICCFVCNNSNVYLYTKTEKYKILKNIEDIIKCLPNNIYIHLNSKYIVNLKHISKFEKDSVEINCNSQIIDIQISEEIKKDLKILLNKM
ncbi:MAG: response regulator transcription factor [Bacteroidales bacterium]|nr:response regulator transcription factor [Bacteroidales bacterium]